MFEIPFSNNESLIPIISIHLRIRLVPSVCTNLLLLLSLPPHRDPPYPSWDQRAHTVPAPLHAITCLTPLRFPSSPWAPTCPTFVPAPCAGLLLLSPPPTQCILRRPHLTGAPTPHISPFTSLSFGAPCGAACIVHPYPTAYASFARPHLVAFRWKKGRTDSQWPLEPPKPRAWLLNQLGLFVACCRNQLGNISKNNYHN